MRNIFFFWIKSFQGNNFKVKHEILNLSPFFCQEDMIKFTGMKKSWLILCQFVTVLFALFFIIDFFGFNIFTKKTITNTIVQVRESKDSTYNKDFKNSFAYAVKTAIPSVVNINTSIKIRYNPNPFFEDPFFRKFFGDQFDYQQEKQTSSLGSGVIISKDGYVITNFHVIEAAEEIEITTHNGNKFDASLIGADPETDLAVLKINNQALPNMILGDIDNLDVGDSVLAIGNPFGVGQTVTMGIVSGLGRNQLGISTFENFIQTDAAINPGNSGGALVDINGDLVGINSAIYSKSGGSMGIGFAIPIDLVKKVTEQIIIKGYVTRGWIGVEVQELTDDLKESFNLSSNSGALIASVVKNSPADKGGLKSGDIIININNKKVGNGRALLNIISESQPDQSIEIEIIRGKRKIKLSLKVSERPRLGS